MVVWVFAGGGEAEVRGLVQFLRKNFSHYHFERKTPININKKTPINIKTDTKPEQAIKAHGKTGKSLAAQIKEILEISFRGRGVIESKEEYA